MAVLGLPGIGYVCCDVCALVGDRGHVDHGTFGRRCLVELDRQIVDRDRAIGGNVEGVATVGRREIDRAKLVVRRIVDVERRTVAFQDRTGGVVNVDRLAFVEIGDDAMEIRQRDRGKIEHAGAVVAALERDGRIDRSSPDGSGSPYGSIEFEI